jgi:hypothetical protein
MGLRRDKPFRRQHRTRPCKKRKDGAPSSQMAQAVKGWATRQRAPTLYANECGEFDLVGQAPPLGAQYPQMEARLQEDAVGSLCLALGDVAVLHINLMITLGESMSCS